MVCPIRDRVSGAAELNRGFVLHFLSAISVFYLQYKRTTINKTINKIKTLRLCEKNFDSLDCPDSHRVILCIKA